MEPNVDTRRSSASVIYNRPLKEGNWQTTLAWGRNDNIPGKTLDGVLLESAVNIRETHTFWGRFERVEKDELFLESAPLHGQKFIVNKLTLGYVYMIFPLAIICDGAWAAPLI